MREDRRRLRLWLRLLRSTRAIEAELRGRLRSEHGMSLPHFDVLAALARARNSEREGLTMTALSRELLVTNGNTTNLVEKLVRDGLVVRVRVDGDRRATRVRLSDAGERRFAEVADEHASWVDEILSSIASNEVDAMLAPLNRFLSTHDDDRRQRSTTL